MNYSLLLLGLGLRTMLLGVVAILAVWASRNRGAEARHAIWRTLLAGMLALPVLAAILPPLPILPSQRVMSIASSVIPAAQILRTPIPFPAERGTSTLSSAALESSVSAAPSISFPVILLAIYGSGTVLLLMRTALAVGRAKKIADAARRIPECLFELGYPRPDLRESADVAVPFTIGWRYPIIVLPNDWRKWDDFKLRSVLEHETSHIRRGDWPTSLAAAINRALFWYNPLAWWLERRLSALAEEICDAAAIQKTGDGLRYARVVLEFAEVASMPRVLIATSMAHTSKAGKRIEGILEGRVTAGRSINGLAAALMLAVALPATYGAATIQLAREPQVPALAQGSSASLYSGVSTREPHQTLLGDGWHVTADQASTLESQLAAHPEDLALRSRLISYYTQQLIAEPRARHVLWLIEHHPEADIFRFGSELTSMVQGYPRLTSPEDSERARALWLNQAERFPTNTKVLANAVLALVAADSRVSLDLLKRARAAQPEDLQWADWLGAVYARAVRVSFAGGREKIRSYTSSGLFSGFPLPLAESEQMKSELETSQDAQLVGATGEALVYETSRLRGHRIDQDPTTDEIVASEAYGKHLLSRARELDPKNPRWQ